MSDGQSAQIPADPIVRFAELLRQARDIDRERLPEPTAFALATVAGDGQPSVRMLLLKGVDDGGFVFYTNYESRKGRELLGSGKAAMCFHWQPLEIQVRIEGPVEPVSGAEADAYFASRPIGSRIGAWASLQSRPIEPPGELARRVEEFERKFASGDIPRPPHWGGFRLVPRTIEFWKNMPNRLHARFLYERTGEAWSRVRLSP